MFLILLAGCGKSGDAKVAPKGTDAPKKENGKEDAPAKLVRRFEDLAEEHLTSPVEVVRKKYTDKIIEVEGEVARLSPTPRGATIDLRGIEPGKDFLIVVYLQSALRDQAALSLSKGQKAKVTGKYGHTLTSQNGALLGTLEASNDRMVLESGEFVALSPSTLKTVAVKDLVREINDNEDVAREKFELKDWIVEGKLLQLSKDPALGKGAAILNQSGPRIECTLGNDDFAGLVAGQDIRLRGYCFGANKDRVSLLQVFVVKGK